MRRWILLLACWAAAFATACADEAGLCSEDPSCVPVGCGPEGCAGGKRSGGGGGEGGPGGAGGADGAGGSGGTVGAPPVCFQACERIYLQCGMVLYDAGGAPRDFDGCLDACAAGSPSQAQAACVAGAICGDFDRCLQPVPATVCDAVCDRVYDECGGSLVAEGTLVDRASCEATCPTAVTLGQASCILGTSCTDWTMCVSM